MRGEPPVAMETNCCPSRGAMSRPEEIKLMDTSMSDDKKLQHRHPALLGPELL
jgi:hypothetical protein